MIETIKNIIIYALVYAFTYFLFKELGEFFDHTLADTELYLLSLISVLFTNDFLKD